MKKIVLGRELKSSRIAYGCMRIGNQTYEDAEKQIRTALELGINFFDNADIYCQGISETYFGKAIRGIGRDSLVIQSKCGIRQGYYDFSKEHIIRSVEGSLNRIGVDYLDVLCLHRPDVLMNGCEVASAFDELQSRGLVRFFGVSNFNPVQVELLKKYIDQPLIVNQLQLGLFHTGMIDSGLCVNMKHPASLDHDGGVLSYSQLNNMVIQAWGPLRSDGGFFTSDKNLDAENQALEKWADLFSVKKEAVAIAWLLRINGVQPLIGTTNLERLRAMAAADGIDMTREQWYNIYKEAGNLIP